MSAEQLTISDLSPHKRDGLDRSKTYSSSVGETKTLLPQKPSRSSSSASFPTPPPNFHSSGSSSRLSPVPGTPHYLNLSQHNFSSRTPSPSLLQPQLSSDSLFALSNQQAQAPRPHHTNSGGLHSTSQPTPPYLHSQSLPPSFPPSRSPSPLPPYASLPPSTSPLLPYPSLPPSTSPTFSHYIPPRHSPTPHSPPRAPRQPVLDSLFNNEKTFDELKKTISNTIRNSTSPSPIPLTPPPSYSPPLPVEKLPPRHKSPTRASSNFSKSADFSNGDGNFAETLSATQKSPTRSSANFSNGTDGNFARSSSNFPNGPDGNFTEISTSSSSSTSSSGSQIKTVKTLVSKFTTQLQTAASSKNANEFIDLLARFSTEYASVMKNEETDQIPTSVLLSAPQQNSHPNLHHLQKLQNLQNVQNTPYESPTSPTLPQKRNLYTEPSAFPQSETTKTKPNENLQLIREMQEMAVSLKARARSQKVDQDVKIMKIAEDILTVLKAQYQADLQAIHEQSSSSLAFAQDHHASELRATIERYERRMHEMSAQHDAQTQQLRERAMSSAGSSDEIRRENAQMRAQIGSLQAEIRTLEVKITTSEEERKEKRRQDLLRGARDSTPDSANFQNEALLAQIRQLEHDLVQARRESERGGEKEWGQKLAAAKEAHRAEMERREKEFSAKLLEMDNMNKALRSSIQQMHLLHRKG